MSVSSRPLELIEHSLQRQLEKDWQYGRNLDRMVIEVNGAIVLLEEMRRIIEGRKGLSGDCDD